MNTHENLWAPWRLPYIITTDKPQPDGCFLCRYSAEIDHDATNHVVARSSKCVVVLNRFPYNNGHLLVAPMAHKAGLIDLDDVELLECQQLLRRACTAITTGMRADGFNIGLNLGKVAGAGLPGHLHWHLVPRWLGDTNYMPVIGGVHVIPQALQALYDWLSVELTKTA
jgi:ATP adenylyltransferase